MSQDGKVIGYVSQGEMLSLMRETGMITVQDTATIDGRPVIHALLKIVNAQSGAELPGGLPFSVVMFKAAAEPGYSNIAIGTVVPATELNIDLPPDFFNLCNQRFRFVRAFPLDATAFVLQMDLFLRNATREYVKFSFGLWAAIFSQVLFELMGNSSTGVSRAAEVYGSMRANMAARFAEAVAGEPVVEDKPVVEPEVADEAEHAAVAAESSAAPEAENAVEYPPETEAVEEGTDEQKATGEGTGEQGEPEARKDLATGLEDEPQAGLAVTEENASDDVETPPRAAEAGPSPEAEKQAEADEPVPA